MMNKNIYYSPEAFGMRTVGEVDFSSGSYEYDTLVVLQDTATGDLFYAEDSGCSCPEPFESEDRSTLIQITRMQEFIEHVEARKLDSYEYRNYSYEQGRLDGEVGDLIMAVSKARG